MEVKEGYFINNRCYYE